MIGRLAGNYLEVKKATTDIRASFKNKKSPAMQGFFQYLKLV